MDLFLCSHRKKGRIHKKGASLQTGSRAICELAPFWDDEVGWELVDPVVADPVAQDNDKRSNIQIYTEISYESTQREGAKLPNMHILSLSCRTGSPTTGSTGCQVGPLLKADGKSADVGGRGRIGSLTPSSAEPATVGCVQSICWQKGRCTRDLRGAPQKPECCLENGATEVKEVE